MKTIKLQEMTQRDRVLYILARKRQNTLTVRQAKSEYNIGNVRAVVSSLRQEGYNIQTNAKTNRDGTVELFYAM